MYFAAATAKAKIWRGPFAVWGFSACKRLGCGAKAASTIASCGNNYGKGANFLVMVLVVGMLMVVVVVVTLPMSMAMVFVIFGFRKKPARGSDDWCMLLPLNP